MRDKLTGFVLRSVDILAAVLGLVLLSPLFLILYILCKYDTGSPFFVQERIGLNGVTFKLFKFRSMQTHTPSVPTHQVDSASITSLGQFIRKYKLDELPQLINVISGDMSLVGPRPCLPSQTALIKQRKMVGVLSVRPGLTGLAQVSGVTMATPSKMIKLDTEMMESLSVQYYFILVFKTFFGGIFPTKT